MRHVEQLNPFLNPAGVLKSSYWENRLQEELRRSEFAMGEARSPVFEGLPEDTFSLTPLPLFDESELALPVDARLSDLDTYSSKFEPIAETLEPEPPFYPSFSAAERLVQPFLMEVFGLSSQQFNRQPQETPSQDEQVKESLKTEAKPGTAMPTITPPTSVQEEPVKEHSKAEAPSDIKRLTMPTTKSWASPAALEKATKSKKRAEPDTVNQNSRESTTTEDIKEAAESLEKKSPERKATRHPRKSRNPFFRMRGANGQFVPNNLQSRVQKREQS